VYDSLVVEGIAIFAIVAALQLPGKSNFGVIALATRHPPRDVFLGACVGLTAATGVSVALGFAAEEFLGPYLSYVKLAGGVVLVAFGVREILRPPAPVHEPGEGTPKMARTPRQVQSLALGLTFLLEMGDNTQILAIVFVAATGNIVLVFLATAGALIAVAALSAAGASYLGRRIPEEHLRYLMGGLLIAVGVLTAVLAFVPSWLPFVA
jgi:putative Ca2+/H+ antiporter (TMEM165/GDT1 family)